MISPEIFYLHLEGEQRGPYTAPQIDHLLNSGLIAEETLYWREGLEQWQPVTSLVKLRRPGNPCLGVGFAHAGDRGGKIEISTFGLRDEGVELR